MFDTDNQLLDKTEEPIVYLHGGYDGIFPLVEEALHGKEVGDTVDVVLSPDDAFGEHDPELVRVEDVSVFPVEVEAGMMFEADDPATGDVIIYRVTDVADGGGGRQSSVGRYEDTFQSDGGQHPRRDRRGNRPRPYSRSARPSSLRSPVSSVSERPSETNWFVSDGLLLYAGGAAKTVNTHDSTLYCLVREI